MNRTLMVEFLLPCANSPIVDVASTKRKPSRHTTLTDVYILKLHKAYKKLELAQHYCAHLESLNDELLVRRLAGTETMREFNF